MISLLPDPVDKSLAFAYVGADAADPGTELDVLILGEQRTAVVLDGRHHRLERRARSPDAQ